MELYAEAGVKRRETPKSIMLKVFIIAGVILSFLFSAIFVGIPVLAVLLAMFFFPRLNVEYEYVFCDGQFDFDKIMGNSRRKTVIRIDMENIEVIAPKNSHALDPFQNNNYVARDFTSQSNDAKPYVIVGSYEKKGENTNVRIFFEPTEKMIQCMKNKAPRKVVLY